MPGRRIVPAAYALGATGGPCDATEFPPSVTVPSPQIANTPDGFRAAVRTMRKYGAWFDMDIYNDDYILAEGAKNGVFA